MSALETKDLTGAYERDGRTRATWEHLSHRMVEDFSKYPRLVLVHEMEHVRVWKRVSRCDGKKSLYELTDVVVEVPND